MKVKAKKGCGWDRLIVVDSEKFMVCVDKENLECRDSQVVENAYHRDWFYESDGSIYFYLPVVQILDGVITFINGRHRTILLSRFLEAFPVAVGSIDACHVGGRIMPRSIESYGFIKLREFDESSFFTLPDLPCGEFKKA